MVGRALQAASVLSLGVWPNRPARAQTASPAKTIDGAVRFLRPRQGADGSWSGTREPGITALVLTALIRSGQVTPDEPAVTKGLGFLEKYIGPKGGLSEAPHSVYTTSVALMAFHEANRDGRYDRVIKGSQEFLKETQYDEGESLSRDDPSYGGLGYGGGNSRPDLSNTSFFIESLRDSGLPANDPALQKALIFVSRCQNLKSEFNDVPWAGKINDGGFIYNPAAGQGGGGGEGGRPGGGRGEGGPQAKTKGGRPPERPRGDGTIRSYAGMTYSGLKSMIYAGLSQDDPRIQAALGFIKNNYTLEENPGQGQRGLYYYYMTFSKAMALLGKPTLVDAKGVEHNWRNDLVAALAKRQDASGSWTNSDDRFMEGDPHIVTSYGLLALASARTKS